MVNVRTLFRIVGEEGPALQELREAVEWLLSPKAEGIGEKLFRDAHAVHGKPLTLTTTATEVNGYYCIDDAHTIKLNLDHIRSIHFKAADGSSQTMSVPRNIAHELVHASQKDLTPEVEKSHDFMQMRAHAAATASIPEAEMELHHAHLTNAIEAPDYDTARQHAGRYVDNHLMPQKGAILRHLHADPEYIDYVQRFEVPAVDVENRIAALRGEFIRPDYNHTPDISPEVMREMMLDQLSHELQIHDKPKLGRADGKSWVQTAEDRTGWVRGG